MSRYLSQGTVSKLVNERQNRRKIFKDFWDRMFYLNCTGIHASRHELSI